MSSLAIMSTPQKADVRLMRLGDDFAEGRGYTRIIGTFVVFVKYIIVEPVIG
ncbi:MAG: hypothetical protein KDA90_19195 [Planctomycetaceae bacterium]|nr:hypothetical protein [Planctomycetaceae bacterium]